MPKPFTDCVRAAGRVRTIKPSPGTYKKICFPKGGGPSKAGETHKKQPTGSK